MSWLDTSLPAVFGAAFGAIAADGILQSATLTDDGAGGFTSVAVDTNVKVLVDSLSETDRAAGGLPQTAVRLTVLRAGFAGWIRIDDGLTVGATTYRVLQVATDAAGASFTVMAVPVTG